MAGKCEARVLKRFAATLILSFLTLASFRADDEHLHPAAGPEKLGKVRFPVSCTAAAQKTFQRAVALLHSFEYEEAEKGFAAAAEADPTCAMSYWGMAMCYWRPLWYPPDATALKNGSNATDKAKSLGAKTQRERDYIAAIEGFYRDSDKLDHATRALVYQKAMEQIYLRYPEDREAAAFYGLALLATAPPTDKTYANQIQAGKILEKVFAEQPDHPGAAHYIIHAFDSPALANLALKAARNYARIAPSSPHALHMPSHIFTRLGLWEESIQSNRASEAAAKAYALKADMRGAWQGQLHAMDYLEYAYLQRAQDAEAKSAVDELRTIRKSQPEDTSAAYAFSAIPARYAIERQRWREAAALTPRPASFPWDRFPWAVANVYFARALGAARTGDIDGARKDVEKLQALHSALLEAKDDYWAGQVEIQRQAGAAWLAFAEGKKDEATELMRSAAELEDSTEKHPVTPGPIIPARELYGDLLLELHEPKQALAAFATSLRASPNRFHGLYGAARGADLSGEEKGARGLYTKLLTLSKQASGQRPELRTARAYLGKKPTAADPD